MIRIFTSWVKLFLMSGMALCLGACWSTSGGDATETGNALTGQVVDEKGKPIAEAEVWILKTNYDAEKGSVSDSMKTQTDHQGRFSFAKLSLGQYSLFERKVSTGQVKRRNLDQTSIQNNLAPDTLEWPGVIRVPVPETSRPGISYVYLAGTPLSSAITAEALSLGYLNLTGVPPGNLPTLYYNLDRIRSIPYSIDSGSTLASGETKSIPKSQLWRNSIRLVLNTGATGINLKENLTLFPIAVRLKSPMFDFSQAMPDGEDLYFTKSDGSPLAHEIELWNPHGSEAIVWVRLDTLKTGQPNQSILLYYNNPLAGNQKQMPFVFDTAAGFSGVWHMNEEAPDTIESGVYRDATPLAQHGNDRILNQGRDGLMGRGHNFVDFDYFVIPSASAYLKPVDQFTLSAWVKSFLPMDTAGDILSMGDQYGLRIRGNGDLYAFYFPPGISDTILFIDDLYENLRGGGTTLRDATWHHVAATLIGTDFSIYIDGRLVATKKVAGRVSYDKRLGNDFVVGKHGFGKRGFQFNGALDEIQVHHVARSVEWLRVVYENEKANSSFPMLEIP